MALTAVSVTLLASSIHACTEDISAGTAGEENLLPRSPNGIGTENEFAALH